MEWLLVALAAGGAGTYGARRLIAHRADRRQHDLELESMRRLADEDVTVLGEELRALGVELEGHELDVPAAQDYQEALDAYERAKWSAPKLRELEEISTVLDTLADGRYAMACVRARVAGEEPPERRVPCFFNPQHGPSTTDVVWRLPRSGTRTYPACRQCAARTAAGQQPELRTIRVGSRVMPYWEAGATHFPYTKGYFADSRARVEEARGWAFQAEQNRDLGPGAF